MKIFMRKNQFICHLPSKISFLFILLGSVSYLLSQMPNIFVKDYHIDEKNTFENVIQLSSENYLAVGTTFFNNGFSGTYTQLLFLDTSNCRILYYSNMRRCGINFRSFLPCILQYTSVWIDKKPFFYRAESP